MPRRTVYCHLGWRRIGDHWAYLHSGGTIHADEALGGIEVDAGRRLPAYELPAVPVASELSRPARFARPLNSDQTRSPRQFSAQSTVRRWASPVDRLSVHLTGPTGVFKSELAAVAQAHVGAGYNSRHLPASWADTANMLEKKAFLAKDAVLVIDDFAPAGTTADVQRLHREADRLFRGQAIARAALGCGPTGAAGRPITRAV